MQFIFHTKNEISEPIAFSHQQLFFLLIHFFQKMKSEIFCFMYSSGRASGFERYLVLMHIQTFASSDGVPLNVVSY